MENRQTKRVIRSAAEIEPKRQDLIVRLKAERGGFIKHAASTPSGRGASLHDPTSSPGGRPPVKTKSDARRLEFLQFARPLDGEYSLGSGQAKFRVGVQDRFTQFRQGRLCRGPESNETCGGHA